MVVSGFELVRDLCSWLDAPALVRLRGAVVPREECPVETKFRKSQRLFRHDSMRAGTFNISENAAVFLHFHGVMNFSTFRWNFTSLQHSTSHFFLGIPRNVARVKEKDVKILASNSSTSLPPDPIS